jgi:hypothetical protein
MVEVADLGLFFPVLLFFPVSITPSLLPIQSCVIWAMNNGFVNYRFRMQMQSRRIATIKK